MLSAFWASRGDKHEKQVFNPYQPLNVYIPVGSNVAVYAQLHNQDYPYAVETVVLSTLLSLATIPGIAYLASVLW